jgi:hypothetical protein
MRLLSFFGSYRVNFNRVAAQNVLNRYSKNLTLAYDGIQNVPFDARAGSPELENMSVPSS